MLLSGELSGRTRHDKTRQNVRSYMTLCDHNLCDTTSLGPHETHCDIQNAFSPQKGRHWWESTSSVIQTLTSRMLQIQAAFMNFADLRDNALNDLAHFGVTEPGFGLPLKLWLRHLHIRQSSHQRSGHQNHACPAQRLHCTAPVQPLKRQEIPLRSEPGQCNWLSLHCPS